MYKEISKEYRKDDKAIYVKKEIFIRHFVFNLV